MNYKGYCLWANDIPSLDSPHYIVIISDQNEEHKVLAVAISSIKNVNGKTKYYDKACILNEGDIVDDNGKNLITKPSFIRYQYATELNTDTILMKQVSTIYKYKTKIPDQLLKRIQTGAKKSLELEPRWQKYFNLF